MGKSCTSCRCEVENDNAASQMDCPFCGLKMVRCGKCRKASASYACNCGFEGP